MASGFKTPPEIVARIIELKNEGKKVREIAFILSIPRPTCYNSIKANIAKVKEKPQPRYSAEFIEHARQLWASDMPTPTVLATLGINRRVMDGLCARNGFVKRTTTGNPLGRRSGSRAQSGRKPSPTGESLPPIPVATEPMHEGPVVWPEAGQCEWPAKRARLGFQACCLPTGSKRAIYCPDHAAIAYVRAPVPEHASA
jgi:hypothetical protein